MEYAEFIKNVKIRAAIADDEGAENACCATLLAIVEYLPGTNAERLMDELPGEFSRCINDTVHGQQYGIQEFYARVSEIEKVDTATAMRHARAFFDVLASAVSTYELDDLRFEFSPDYEDLFGTPMVKGI